jgi:hypothetical protein
MEYFIVRFAPTEYNAGVSPFAQTSIPLPKPFVLAANDNAGTASL